MGMLETNFLIRAEGYNVWFAEWNSILGVSDSYALVMDFMEWYYKVTTWKRKYSLQFRNMHKFRHKSCSGRGF